MSPLSRPTSGWLPSFAAALAAASLCLPGQAAESPKPNYVFLAVDDLNDYVGFLFDRPENFIRKLYPEPARREALARRLTPNLQRLADQSLVFTRAYCASPLCGPSRTALLTGVPPHVSGYYQHTRYFRTHETLRDAVTLPQYLRHNGYRTVGLGKVFHGPTQRKDADGSVVDWPDIERSWSLFVQRPIGPRGPGAKITRSPYSPGSGARATKDSGLPGTDSDTGTVGKVDVDDLFAFGQTDLAPENTYDFQNARFAAELISRRKASIVDRAGTEIEAALPEGQPYFLACGIFAPHLPWVVPPRFYDLVPVDEMAIDDALLKWVQDDIADLPEQALREFTHAFKDWEKFKAIGEGRDGPGGQKAAWRAAVQAYLASVAYADYCLGQIVDALEKSPDRDNTVVVLWSDNGWNLGDKRRFRKQALWEAANHCVLLIRDPRNKAARGGRTCERLVSLQDIYPTLVSSAGLPRPAHVYGHDLSPLLADPASAWDFPVLATYNPGNHVVRTETATYIRYREGGQELYDTANDAYEYRNQASESSSFEKLGKMDALLERLLAEKPGTSSK